MESLVLEIGSPDTIHAIAEAAKRQSTTPEVGDASPVWLQRASRMLSASSTRFGAASSAKPKEAIWPQV